MEEMELLLICKKNEYVFKSLDLTIFFEKVKATTDSFMSGWRIYAVITQYC